jgi:hypothetical protein
MDNLDNMYDVNEIYKNKFKAFLYENTLNDTCSLKTERSNKIAQFYFKEFLQYEAGITSQFWCCPFGKQILKQIENRDYHDIILYEYQEIIYNVYGNINLDEFVEICNELLL